MVRGLFLLCVLFGATARADVATCFGKARGTVGTCFGKVHLGQTTPGAFPVLGDDIDATVERNGTRVDAIVLSISDATRKPPLCPALLTALKTRWGALNDMERWTSVAGVSGVEATVLDPPGCTFRFYRTVPPAQWLNTTRRSVVPVWAIGKKASELRAALTGRTLDIDDTTWIVWSDTSIDGGETALSAYLDAKGRITGIEVGLMTDEGHGAWRRLKAVYGAPATAVNEDAAYTWTWTKKPGISAGSDAPDLTAPPGPGRAARVTYPTTPYEGTHLTIVFGTKP